MRADKTKKPAYGQGDRWRVVWIDPESKRERSTQFSKKTDADAFRTAKEHSLRDGAYVSPEVEAMTVGEVLTVWISSKKRPKDSSLKSTRMPSPCTCALDGARSPHGCAASRR